ncbi:MAG TPA: hypothetical protein VKB28_07650 [Solirubrobacteraceae bacterium]|nr:hypothetical protein [Solirubrobacteraceae bacterium]
MTVSLRRPLAVAAVLFVLILAFLAGRVHAGTDPAQVTAPAADAVQPATPGTDPYDGFAPGAPPQDAVPEQGGVPSPGGQDLDPPVTQAS